MRAAVWAAWPAMATSSPLRGQDEPHRVPVPMRDWAVATGSSLGVLVALVTVVVVVTHWNRRERAVRTRPAVTPPPSSPPHGQDSLPQARPAPGGEAQPSHPDADALVTPHVQPGAPALGGSSTLTHINDWLSGGTLRSQVPVQSLPEQKAPCRQRSKAPCQGSRATPTAASARVASATEHDGPGVRAGNHITPGELPQYGGPPVGPECRSAGSSSRAQTAVAARAGQPGPLSGARGRIRDAQRCTCGCAGWANCQKWCGLHGARGERYRQATGHTHISGRPALGRCCGNRVHDCG